MFEEIESEERESEERKEDLWAYQYLIEIK